MSMSDENVSIVEFSEDIATAERPEELPAGEYDAEIREAKCETSQKNNRYAAVALFIRADQYPPTFVDGNPDGTTLIFRRLSLEDNPRSRYQIKEFFERIGLPAPGRAVDLNQLMGHRVRVLVKHGEFEGNPRAEAAKILRAA